MAKPLVSVDSLVDSLRSAEGAPITSARVADLLCGVRLDHKSLRPYVSHVQDHYTRHLIHRDRHFDIMVLCWLPGHTTPVHTHNGQLGWALVTQGALECTEYRWLGCDRPQNQDVSGLDCLAGGNQVRLDRLRDVTCTPGGDINVVGKRVTTHALRVPEGCDEPVVSLHVYSLPFDSCVVFDLEQGRCGRRQLAFDSAPDGYDVPRRQ